MEERIQKLISAHLGGKPTLKCFIGYDIAVSQLDLLKKITDPCFSPKCALPLLITFIYVRGIFLCQLQLPKFDDRYDFYICYRSSICWNPATPLCAYKYGGICLQQGTFGICTGFLKRPKMCREPPWIQEAANHKQSPSFQHGIEEGRSSVLILAPPTSLQVFQIPQEGSCPQIQTYNTLLCIKFNWKDTRNSLTLLYILAALYTADNSIVPSTCTTFIFY